MTFLLIYPPAAKICEPPAGIARLAAFLKNHDVPCMALDANIAAIQSILESSDTVNDTADTWTRRAYRALPDHLCALKTMSTYQNHAKYGRAVSDLNRVLSMKDTPRFRISASNYQDSNLTPVRARDLVYSFAHPKENPFYPFFENRLTDILKSNDFMWADFIWIGLSVNFLSQALTAFALAGYIKKAAPHVKLIMGGGLITSWMRRPDWGNPFERVIDHLVAGPGEEALLDLLNITPKKISVRPDFSDFRQNHYLAPGFILPYAASSGCWWNKCAFCPEQAEKNPYIPIPEKQAALDLKKLVEENNPVLIHFLDNAISPRVLKSLIRNPPGKPWYGFVRITKHLADPRFCRDLKQSGCVMLKLGLESGSQRVLDMLKKGVSLEMASKALNTLKQCSIATYVYLLFGTPAETLDDAQKTLAFTAAHADTISFLNLAVFNLPAYGLHTESGIGSVKTQDFYEGDLSIYREFQHPAGWNRDQVRRFLAGDFKKHPAIAPIIRRDPPSFTSNHAAFFVMND